MPRAQEPRCERDVWHLGHVHGFQRASRGPCKPMTVAWSCAFSDRWASRLADERSPHIVLVLTTERKRFPRHFLAYSYNGDTFFSVPSRSALPRGEDFFLPCDARFILLVLDSHPDGLTRSLRKMPSPRVPSPRVPRLPDSSLGGAFKSKSLLVLKCVQMGNLAPRAMNASLQAPGCSALYYGYLPACHQDVRIRLLSGLGGG